MDKYANALFKLAELYTQSAQTQKAIQTWIQLAQANQPQDISTLQLWLNVYQLDPDHLQAMENILDHASKMTWTEQSEDFERLSRIVDQRVKLEIKQSSSQDAFMYCSKVLEWFRFSKPALEYAIRMYIEQGKVVDAEAWITSLKMNHPDSALLCLLDALQLVQAGSELEKVRTKDEHNSPTPSAIVFIQTSCM